MIYYSELERINNIERLFERLAYFSVGLDFLVALATFLVMWIHFSNIMLLVVDYLMLFEVILAAAIFVILMVLKHYNRLLESITSKAFKSRHSRNIFTKAFAEFISFIFQLI